MRPPLRIIPALWRAVAIWLVGLMAGMIVFSIPALKSAQPIPYLTSNPYITGIILVCWIPLLWFVARRYVSKAIGPANEGIRLGAVMLAVNVVLDHFVVVRGFEAGMAFYSYAGVWIAYALLIFIPWLATRSFRPE